MRSGLRPSCRPEGAGYASAHTHSPQEQIMGKYVLGWFLGVPLIVLVAIYFIAH